MWTRPIRHRGAQGRAITRRPRPSTRFTRAQLEAIVASLRAECSRLQGVNTAHSAWVAALLEQTADAHQLDADHAGTLTERRGMHRVTADALRDLARDVERGMG